ncbi:hypothetical protein PINS_up024399 [Pythium insidiosum]|nr:hypothetical protein PINS_up024399 [Pythium insidiosum]
MKVLKHELSSVQELLRKCQQTSTSATSATMKRATVASKQKPPLGSSYDDLLSVDGDSALEDGAVDDRERAERRRRRQQLLRHRADVEKAVLQSAIMEQVAQSAVR